MSKRTSNSFFLIVMMMTLSCHMSLARDFQVIEDLGNEWKYYDETYEALMPFLEGNGESPESIQLSLELAKYKDLYLRLEAPKGSSFLIDGKFCGAFNNESSKTLAIDSLIKTLKKEEITIILYCPDGFSGNIQSGIGFFKAEEYLGKEMNPIIPRQTSHQRDYFIILLLVLMAFSTLVYNVFPSEFSDSLNIAFVFSFRTTEISHSKFKGLTKIQLLFIFYLSTVIAFLLLLFIIFYPHDLSYGSFVRTNILTSWFVLILVVFFAIFFKYLLISGIGILFNLQDKSTFYFSEYFRMSMIFHLVVFLFCMTLILMDLGSFENIIRKLLYIAVGFYIFRTLIIYFKFRSGISIKNLHLFSYLCVTEILPIIIGLKYFL